MKRVLAVLLLCLILSGCDTLREMTGIPTADQREQMQRLYAAQNALAGDYVVVDSRLDFLQIESVTLIPQKHGTAFIFHRKNGDIVQFGEDRCVGDLRSTKYTCWLPHGGAGLSLQIDCDGFTSEPQHVSCMGNLPAYTTSKRVPGWHHYFDSTEGPSYIIDFSENLSGKSKLVTNSRLDTKPENLPPYSPMEVKPGYYNMSLEIIVYDPEWIRLTPAASMILRDTTDGKVQYALKRIALDKSERSGVEQ